MAKIAIIGGAGFIGYHLINALKDDHELLCIDLIHVDSIDCEICDITNAKEVEEVFEKHQFDIVIHLAAIHITSEVINTPLRTVHTNIMGLTNVLYNVVKTKVSRFMFPSTAFVYQQYDNDAIVNEQTTIDEKDSSLHLYALTKLMGESMIVNFHNMYGVFNDFKYHIFRFGTTYGEKCHNNVIRKFITDCHNNCPIEIFGSADNTRSFLDVADHVKVYTQAIKHNPDSGIYNADGIQPVTISRIAEIAKSLTNNKCPVAISGARKKDYKGCIIDSSKTEAHLKWKPKISIEDGMKELYKHIVDEHN